MPQISGVDVKWWVVGGALAGGVVWWAYKRNKAAAATPTDAGIDPATGLPYAGTSPIPPTTGVTPSAYGYIDPSTGAFIGGSGAQQIITAPSTNAQWAQEVEAYLTQLGFNPLTVATAIGKYLTGQFLTPEQLSIVQSALGFKGKPPVLVPPPQLLPPSGQTSGSRYQYTTQYHQIGVATSGRALVQRFSDQSVATPDRIESALRSTVSDPRNLRYRAYYSGHNGRFPAQAGITVHVVKAK